MGILPLVLRPRVRAFLHAQVHRQTLHGPLPERQVHPQGADAVHAVLLLVPPESSEEVEDPGIESDVRQLRLGRRPWLLEPLSLVLQATGRTIVAVVTAGAAGLQTSARLDRLGKV